ncbi:MAG: hypothetical protein ABIP49_09280 [Lysobacterales bacterium]
MTSGFRKFLLVPGALLIAGAITYYPWTCMDDFTGAASTFYGLTALFWAPGFLIAGLLTGFLFAFTLWPRKPKVLTKADHTGPSSIEA